MNVTRSREYTINMGNYESLKIGASITFDSEEQNGVLGEGEELHQFLDKALDVLLEDEVKEAQELTHTKDSYILSYRVKK